MKMHKDRPFPRLVIAAVNLARMRAPRIPVALFQAEYTMSDEQSKNRDQVADAIATVALITIAVLGAVLWVSGQG